MPPEQPDPVLAKPLLDMTSALMCRTCKHRHKLALTSTAVPGALYYGPSLKGWAYACTFLSIVQLLPSDCSMSLRPAHGNSMGQTGVTPLGTATVLKMQRLAGLQEGGGGGIYP